MTTTARRAGARVGPWRPAATLPGLVLAAVAAMPLVAAAQAKAPATAVQVAQAAPAAQAPAPQAPAAPETAVAVGQAAPDFTLPYLVPKDGGGFDTRQVSLAGFRGKKNVVLAFFPAAFSPG